MTAARKLPQTGIDRSKEQILCVKFEQRLLTSSEG